MGKGFQGEYTLLARAKVWGMLYLCEEGFQVLESVIWPMGHDFKKNGGEGHVELCALGHAGLG